MTKVRSVIIPLVLLTFAACGADDAGEGLSTTTSSVLATSLPPPTTEVSALPTTVPLPASTQTTQTSEVPATVATVATPATTEASATTTGPTADHDEDSPPIELSVYWESCEAAAAAGAVPIPAGTAGYRSGLDPNGDGIACGG